MLAGMWIVERSDRGEVQVTGAIGDPLHLRVVAIFDPPAVGDPWDFTEHVWLAQVRRRVPAPLVATFTLLDDSTAVDGDGVCTVDLTFGLDDTTGLLDCARHLYGVKAIDGPLAPYTLIRAAPVVGYDGVPRPE